MRRVFVLVLLGAAALLSAWAVASGRFSGREQAATPPTLRVFAAASLTDALAEVARRFEAEHPGVRVEASFAGSQTLRVQIEQGAPADVFASADMAQMEPLVRAGLMQSPDVFARNRLVVAVPRGGTVRNLADLALPGLRLVLAAPEVPAGHYTGTVLDRMARSGRFGPDFAERVRANVSSRETSVRAVLAKVAMGEADAGIVYATDVAASDGRARAVPIPDPVNVSAEYPIAVAAASTEPDLARAFVAMVRGPEGRAILQRHGFAW